MRLLSWHLSETICYVFFFFFLKGFLVGTCNSVVAKEESKSEFVKHNKNEIEWYQDHIK